MFSPNKSNYFPEFYDNHFPDFPCGFTTYVCYHIFNMHIFHIVIDSNQDEEDQEEMEPEEGNGMHLSSY